MLHIPMENIMTLLQIGHLGDLTVNESVTHNDHVLAVSHWGNLLNLRRLQFPYLQSRQEW